MHGCTVQLFERCWLPVSPTVECAAGVIHLPIVYCQQCSRREQHQLLYSVLCVVNALKAMAL